VIKTFIRRAGLACLGILLFACTTTYQESDVSEKPVDEPAGEAPNCSILADQPGCAEESPFDPQDDEQEF